jgi:hypothetical protein
MDKLIRALALSACFALPAHAASGVLIAETKGKASLLISGDLEENDDVRIAAMVSTFGAGNVTATMLTSNGGDVETAFRLSDLVNLTIGKPVYVVGGCYSACAFVALAAGDRLTVLTGGKLAVHQVWVRDGQADLVLTKQITDWLRDCGVPESILKKVLSTTPQNMAKISTNELRAMGARVE